MAEYADRLTMNMNKRGVAALDHLIEMTGESKTDLVNKALTFYDYALTEVDNGGAVHVTESDGEQVKVIFL